MAYKYTTIDGQRVEVHVAAAYKNLKREFDAHRFSDGKRYKLDVTAGTRTRAEQERLYRAWLNGTGSLAAVPGYSHHEADGPVGPRALDLHDSGANAGVTVMGTERCNYLASIVAKHGFDNAGFTFSPQEAWHKEYTRALTGPLPASTAAKPITKDDDMPEYTLVSFSLKEKLAKGKTQWIHLNTKNYVSFVTGKRRAVEVGKIRLSGLPKGAEAQVRFVRSEVVPGKKDVHHKGAITEIIGTGGDTFGEFTDVTGMGKYSRLRAEITVFEDGVTLDSGSVKVLSWK